MDMYKLQSNSKALLCSSFVNLNLKYLKQLIFIALAEDFVGCIYPRTLCAEFQELPCAEQRRCEVSGEGREL